jgi:hypothetical protein
LLAVVPAIVADVTVPPPLPRLIETVTITLLPTMNAEDALTVIVDPEAVPVS